MLISVIRLQPIEVSKSDQLMSRKLVWLAKYYSIGSFFLLNKFENELN